MPRAVRTAALAIALVAVAPPVAAFAEPDPPRPFCQLHFREHTLSSSDGTVPDVTIYEPYWVC